MSSAPKNFMVPADFPVSVQAGHRLTIAHIEAALSRWRERKLVTLHITTSPAEVLARLLARMTTRRETSIRWIDLIFVERHALGILYPHPVGSAWPGLPPD
ncbi:hypothetical protein R69658_08190 [Paraburkholderia aspalathi]|uniref:Uncharacterized protein n=2 Tax=Paraburkholderia aspalathi TaxID=1324617 RepID=A0ABN7NI35_9BURK|nr:hypothetical protein R69746_08124 [Paraburkholderia aspalathi]CAE6871673.1 hypothetical protein R69658_08190 [Paraburkholderia aspalathi]CAE6871780.1 hypothetical protein R75465_08326 [Paraburkholderia aspalathi]